MAMCGHDSLAKSPSKADYEMLRDALQRTFALKRTWCEDGQRILGAAQRHLETLPKPSDTLRDAVREARLAIERGYWHPRTEHLRVLAEAGDARLAVLEKAKDG